MSYDSNNIFAKIIRKEIPCQQVYEDEMVIAFHDIHPKAPTHILVLPKGEYINFHDFHGKAPANHVAHFYKKVADIALECGLNGNGYRIIANCGPNGGQEIDHYHVHILGGKPLGPMVSPGVH